MAGKLSEQTSNQNALAELFTRHLTLLEIQYEYGEGKQRSAILSAFLLRVEDYAFIVSAGHIREDIESVLSKPAYSNPRFYILDGGAGSASDHYKVPLPLEYVRDNMSYIDWEGYDYSFLPLPEGYYNLILANGVVPLDEEFWDGEVPSGNSFAVVGVPQEWCLMGEGARRTEFYYCLKTFAGLAEKPLGMEGKPEGTVFGEIPMDPSLTDISGMSGGPVFKVECWPNGQILRYKLVGVQSVWRDRRYIAASPISALIDILKERIRRSEP